MEPGEQSNKISPWLSSTKTARVDRSTQICGEKKKKKKSRHIKWTVNSFLCRRYDRSSATKMVAMRAWKRFYFIFREQEWAPTKKFQWGEKRALAFAWCIYVQRIKIDGKGQKGDDSCAITWLQVFIYQKEKGIANWTRIFLLGHALEPHSLVSRDQIAPARTWLYKLNAW